MKIKLYSLLILIISLILLSGCRISKTNTTTQENQIEKNITNENSTNLSSSDQTNSATENSTENDNNISDQNAMTQPINKTSFIVTASDINGYHESIKDVNELNLNIDLSDPRLNALIAHLSAYEYNFQTHQIGEVTLPKSLFIVTNKLNHLPADYIPENLVEPAIQFSFSEANEKRNQRPASANALELMFKGAELEDLHLFAVSGYRSYSRQKSIYNYKVETRGVEEADKVSARPGHSEHQTGLAMDITCESIGFGLEYEFGTSPEGIWVATHAHDYGLIIRYPEDKVDITGYNYEPWHLRYVGLDIASYIYEHDLTIEELYSSISNQLKE